MHISPNSSFKKIGLVVNKTKLVAPLRIQIAFTTTPTGSNRAHCTGIYTIFEPMVLPPLLDSENANDGCLRLIDVENFWYYFRNELLSSFSILRDVSRVFHSALVSCLRS